MVYKKIWPANGLSETENDYSSKGDDSNSLILPEKKKSRRKAMKKVEARKIPCLSKSQKRKLKKLQEEKEKAALLSKSIDILEKYKIKEDAISLLQSSGNIGKVETMREKRRRAMQFSKVGLEVPEDDKPNKRVGCHGNAHQEYESNLKNFLQPKIRETGKHEDVCQYISSHQEITCSNAPGKNGGSYTALPIGDHGTCMQDKLESSALTSYTSSSGMKISRSLDREDNSPKVDLCATSIPADAAAVDRPVRAPTVVHVLRPNEVEIGRKDLPIVMMEQEIMEAINEHSAVIICGETGCGKTTQVPQFLYEAGFGSNKSYLRSGIIGVTQPRRVAVLSTAKRVAFELGLRLGKEVGFQVRYDKRIGDNCSIKFMTDGILLREVQNDFLLKRYSVIILDEAHERSLNTDILIGMLSRIIKLRQRLYEEQQHKLLAGEIVNPENIISQLKLVLMSATLRVEDFVSGKRLFHETPPVIEVPTRQFPVTIHFSKRTEIVDYVGQAYKKVLSIHKRLPPGGILVFVTGQREVEYLCQKLRKASREMTLHGSRGKMGDDVASFLETNLVDPELDMREIDEAFEIHGHSSDQKIAGFSSYDHEHFDPDVDNSDFSCDSGTESELEFDIDERDSSNCSTSMSKDDLINGLGESVSLGSLKAAFEALASKDALTINSEGKQSLDAIPVTIECPNESSSLLGNKEDGKLGLCVSALRVLPLYAMLPAAAQLRVFDEVPEGERLVVVATNVAETSLTIPGIKYVVDTGREKVKNYNSSTGMESYEVQWISKASAAQRAGRAGRTGPGHCYRLYSSAAFGNILSDFSSAEISKIPVDGVVLLMKSMGIDKVVNFPFPTPPEAPALVEAERCLKVLEALDCQGKLTPLGKAMALYPMSPRHSRMLLTVIQTMRSVRVYARANLVLGYAVATAAALSLSNPFVMHFDGMHTNGDLDQEEKSCTEETQKILKQQEKMGKKKLKEMGKLARAKFSNPSSDALTIAYALQCFELAVNPVEFCNSNVLHLKTMEEMSKLRKQLLQLVFQQNILWGLQQEFSWTHGTIEDVEQSWRVSSDKSPLLLNEEELLGQAICAGWPDRVAKRIRAVSGTPYGERKANAVRYQACMVKETVFLHRWSSVSQSAPEFLVYSELLNTKRPYMHGATSMKSDWLVKFAGSVCSFSAPLTDPKPYYEPLSDQVFCWVQPTFGPHLWQLPLHKVPINNDLHRVSVFAYALLEGHVLPCLRSVQKFMAAPASTILRPEALGQKRVGNLLNKLKSGSRKIDSRAMLRETWNENPQELHLEILDWFQDRFHNHFEELWARMQHEVLLKPQQLFPERLKKGKRKR